MRYQRSFVGAYIKSIVAGVIILGSIAMAFALNNDQNRIYPKRTFRTQQIGYYRLTVNFNDPRISTAQLFGALSQNTLIVRVMCYVSTTFNASTNAGSLGTTTGATEISAASGSNNTCALGTAGWQDLTSAAGLGLAATSLADVSLYAKYAQTGTAATQGAVTYVIEFVQNNDM